MSYEASLGWSEVPASIVPWSDRELCRVRGLRPVCMSSQDFAVDPNLAKRNQCKPSRSIFGAHHNCTTQSWRDAQGNSRGGLRGKVYCCPPGRPVPTPTSPELRSILQEQQAARATPSPAGLYVSPMEQETVNLASGASEPAPSEGAGSVISSMMSLLILGATVAGGYWFYRSFKR